MENLSSNNSPLYKEQTLYDNNLVIQTLNKNAEDLELYLKKLKEDLKDETEKAKKKAGEIVENKYKRQFENVYSGLENCKQKIAEEKTKEVKLNEAKNEIYEMLEEAFDKGLCKKNDNKYIFESVNKSREFEVVTTDKKMRVIEGQKLLSDIELLTLRHLLDIIVNNKASEKYLDCYQLLKDESCKNIGDKTKEMVAKNADFELVLDKNALFLVFKDTDKMKNFLKELEKEAGSCGILSDVKYNNALVIPGSLGGEPTGSHKCIVCYKEGNKITVDFSDKKITDFIFEKFNTTSVIEKDSKNKSAVIIGKPFLTTGSSASFTSKPLIPNPIPADPVSSQLGGKKHKQNECCTLI